MANDRRERIIGAAWKLFREKGFAEATINDIINEASISKGTFYYYFRSKDDLLDTLSEILDREYERLDGIEPQDLSCFDKLMWLNYEVHSFMEKNIDYRLLSYLYSAQIIKEDFSSLLNRNRYYYRYVERLMYDSKRDGQLFQYGRESSCYRVVHAERKLFIWRVQQKALSYNDARSQKTVKLLIDLLRATIYNVAEIIRPRSKTGLKNEFSY